MLGLGLALKVGKRIIAIAGDALFSALKSRATYYENETDSIATKNAIDTAGVLDDATILLTPTAYSNERVHSVKTYTGDELVTNGDFSNWTGDNPDNYLVLNENANNYVTENSGQLRMVSDNSATIAIRPQPTTMLTVGNTYRVSVDLTFTTGTLDISGVSFNTSGTKVFYLTAATTYLQLAKASTLDVLIDNLSIIDVSSDFAFDRASSATRINSSGLVQDMQSITDPELVLNGNFDTDSDWTKLNATISGGKGNLDGDGQTSLLYQNILTNGKTYKATFTVSDYNGLGEARIINNNGGAIYTITSDGTFTIYFTHSIANGNFFIRATSGAVFSIDNVSVKDITFSTEVDLARINYDGSGANGHILLEPTSTNLLTYSESYNVTTTNWSNNRGGTASNPVVTEDDATSPDGNNTADKIVFNNGGGTTTSDYTFLSYGYTSAADDFTLSIYLKGEVGGEQLFIDLDNQNSNVVTLTTSWQRFDITRTSISTTTRYIRFGLRGGYGTDTGSITIYAWGTQLEQLPYPTSYIPTLTGSTVTRAAETLTGSGNSTLINSTEGVLYAEIAALANDNSRRAITISDGTLPNVVTLRYDNASNRIQGFTRVGNSVVNNINTTSFSILDTLKIAYKWKANDFALWVNGTEAASSTTGSSFGSGVLNTVQFNEGDGAGTEFYGKVKTLALFDRALTDQELTDLTT